MWYVEKAMKTAKKNKRGVVWKTNGKGDEACGKENENKDKQRSGENNEKIKELLSKTR